MVIQNTTIIICTSCEQGLDIGSQLERINKHCETGFPDVHLNYIMNDLGGVLDSEVNIPDTLNVTQCFMTSDFTRTRVTDYIADYFTTEDYLIDAITQVFITLISI